MAKTIKTPEPHTRISYGGEHYLSDAKGLVTVPDAAVAVLVGSHGCVDPDTLHKYGLSLKRASKGKFTVVDRNGNALHAGAVDHPTAIALMKNWSPEESAKDEDEGGGTEDGDGEKTVKTKDAGEDEDEGEEA